MNPNKLFSRAAEGGFEEIEKKGEMTHSTVYGSG
jgi:hypothetical protein